MRSRKGATLTAAGLVVTVVASATVWWLSDKDQKADADFSCSLVGYSSSVWVVPTAPIQQGWPRAATYEARADGGWSPLRGFPGKNRLQVVGVTAPDQPSIPVTVRVLDGHGRTLWADEIATDAPPSEPNGKGCGTYYQAGVALDVAARQLRQRPVPKGFRF